MSTIKHLAFNKSRSTKLACQNVTNIMRFIDEKGNRNKHTASGGVRMSSRSAFPPELCVVNLFYCF